LLTHPRIICDDLPPLFEREGGTSVYGRWGVSQYKKYDIISILVLRNCLKFEMMQKIKKFTPVRQSPDDFLIFRAPFRVWGNPKNQNELNLNSFLEN
jgi:hypothetical protein